MVGAVAYFVCDRADLPHCGPDRLRHTVATETLRAGASLPEVSQLLRHAAASTSAIYAVPGPASVAAPAKPWPVVQ